MYDDLDEGITEKEFLNQINYLDSSEGEFDPGSQKQFKKPIELRKLTLSEIKSVLKINKSKTKYWLK